MTDRREGPPMSDRSTARILERERRRTQRRQLLGSGPPSPCISVCQIDDATGRCKGCYRTIDEIRDWLILLPDERQRILERLAARRAAVAPWS